MRVDIPKDNPNMTCQAVPLQAQSMVSNHPDHDPPSRPDATPVLSHRPPPPTRTHHKPTTAVLVHRPCPMPTRHRVRHQHHDQPRIRHNGSTTATPGVRHCA
ncbi:unnamed protein product [Pleuronectes platessa]|uniref:Uncharacterized protein n=1 Tax=Pleuronectes platessa TaxID=8262 RepID=A0A9N7Z892_PLEPL|nr:unnamed protein product [Pleuronectes platessa]